MVRPWRVVLQQRTEQIEWTLLPSEVTSVTITPKTIAGWPFRSPQPPLVVTTQKPGVASDIPREVPGATYKYNITGICGRSGQPADTVVIDPDMIIPPI